jgi:chromate transport protein ChrA
MRNSSSDQPERQMALRALVPGVVLAAVAFGVGYLVNGLRAAVCALLGVVLVSVSFAVYVVVLGRARKVSAGALQGAVLGGWLIRMAVIVAALAIVKAVGGDVAAFGFAAIATAIAVAVYEAWFVMTGRLQPAPQTGAAGSGA